jgi:hypothetical protein
MMRPLLSAMWSREGGYLSLLESKWDHLGLCIYPSLTRRGGLDRLIGLFIVIKTMEMT